MDRRMTSQSLAVYLLLVGSALPQVYCQHWSFGLSPGGKRELDGLSGAQGTMAKSFPRVDSPCSVLGCEEESPFAKMYRMKAFLSSIPDGENGPRPFKK